MLIKKSVYLGVFCILTIGSPVYASNLTNFNDPNTDQLISAFKNKSSVSNKILLLLQEGFFEFARSSRELKLLCIKRLIFFIIVLL